MEIKFLNDEQLPELYRTFVDSFSNYPVPFYPPTFGQFKSDLWRDGVDVSRSVGTFDRERLIGFSLNGFGNFSGGMTAYVASTGILPEYRQQHIASSMFEWMFPKLKEQGCPQMVLEVISSNRPAIHLYERLGFALSRELTCYQQTSKPGPDIHPPMDIEIGQLQKPEPEFASFWDAEPSWQNSFEAVSRTLEKNRVYGAYAHGRVVAYIVMSPASGTIIQIAVDPKHRRQGIGVTLVRKAHRNIAIGKNLRILNVDSSADSLKSFLASQGFAHTITQLEMRKSL